MLNLEELKILNYAQKMFPLVERPFKVLAKKFNTTEDKVITLFKTLSDERILSRVGPVFQPNSIGASTLAAFAVERDQLDKVAAIVTSFESVNHNYARSHKYNLWFVITAPDQDCLDTEIEKMEKAVNLKMLVLPLVKEYHIDLGFNLEASSE